MTRRDLQSKISIVKRYLLQAKRYSKLKSKDLIQIEEKRLAAERALFLLVQSCIDLAEAYCALKDYRQPSSMHESFDILCEYNFIDTKLNEHLQKMVGFRNILTHGYTKIDYKKVEQILKAGLKDIEKFLRLFK